MKCCSTLEVETKRKCEYDELPGLVSGWVEEPGERFMASYPNPPQAGTGRNSS